MHSIERAPDGEWSLDIVNRIASIEDTAIDALPPLYEVLDPESLDILLESSDTTVSFTYCGYEITATSDGSLSITDEADVTE